MPTVREIVMDAINEWKGNNSPASIRARAIAMLDKNRDAIIVKMAGFDNHWFDRWEVDHCNGRRSAVDNYVVKVAQEAVNEWIDANLDKLPTMTDGMREAFVEDYKAVYEDTLRDALRAHAEERAVRDAEALVEQAYQEMGEPQLIKFPVDTKGDDPEWWS